MRNVLIGLALFMAVLGGTSCVRTHTTSTTDRDTSYQKRKDSLAMVANDKKAPEKVEKEIETVFMEVAGDCPNVAPDTIVKWKTRIKNVANHEALSGGFLIGESKDGKKRYLVKFNKNSAIIYSETEEPTIFERITKTVTIERKIWYYWKEFLISITIASIVFFILGKIL